MNAKWINPFLKSSLEVLTTMAQLNPKPGKPFLKKDRTARGDVTGMIGLVGKTVRGSLAVSFTEAAVREIAFRMLGERPTELDSSVADMVGEITNMITGGAKRVLWDAGFKFDMAIPTTIVGANHMISHNTSGPVIVVPFEMEGGSFFIEVCFEE